MSEAFVPGTTFKGAFKNSATKNSLMQYFEKMEQMQKKKKTHSEQNTRILNIDRSVMVPSHIEARGKEKISNSDLVNHGLGGIYFD